MARGSISHDRKSDLVTIRGGNLNGDQYLREVLQPVVEPYCDNHSLAATPVLIDNNASLHRSRAVIAFLQVEAVNAVQLPAITPDLNPIEHVRPSSTYNRINCSKFTSVEAARNGGYILQQEIRRLTGGEGGLRRRVAACIRSRGGFHRY